MIDMKQTRSPMRWCSHCHLWFDLHHFYIPPGEPSKFYCRKMRRQGNRRYRDRRKGFTGGRP